MNDREYEATCETCGMVFPVWGTKTRGNQWVFINSETGTSQVLCPNDDEDTPTHDVSGP